MKKFFKFTPIIMAVILIILSSIPFASAAELLDSTKKVTITVKCTKPGYTFNVYKVATLDTTTTTPYETKYTSLVPEIDESVLSGDNKAALAALDKIDMPSTATSVGIWKSSATATVKAFSNLEQGIYYIKAVNYPAGVKSVTNSIVSLPYYNGSEWVYTVGEVNLASKVVDEDVTTVKTITNSTKDNVNYTDVSLGDTVNFELKSTTTGSSTMKLGSYTVYDDMSKGLTLNKDSFNVALLKADGTVITNLEPSEYTVNVTSEAEGANTLFNVALTNAYLQTEEFYASDVYYTSVTYSAVLNKYAVVGTPGNPNTEVKLEYSNKNGVTAEVEGNTVYVYTYAIKTNKYDETGSNPLAGAEFTLFATEENANELENALATGTSDENGLVKYYNANGEEMRLQSGTYYVRETKAPTGYVIYGDIIEVPVNATYGDTLTDGTYVTSCPEDGYVSFDINNHTVFLPQTGGTGRVNFAVLSLIALASGLVFLFFYRKRKSEAK